MTEPPRQLADTTRQIMTIVIVAVALYFAIGVAGRAITLVQLKMQLSDLQSQRTTLQQEIATENGNISYMQTDSYIEQAARTMLLWGRPGEKLIISPDGAQPTAPTAAPQPNPCPE